MTASCSGVIFFGTLVPLPLVLALFTLLGASIPLVFNSMFMSRKDRGEADQTRFVNSRDILATQTERRNDFMAALMRAGKKTKPSMDDILAIMKTGEAYFETLRVMAQAVLDRRISENTRDHDFVPKISEALLKNIPLYYETLAALCAKQGMPFNGVFSEENYESLFRVVDGYDHDTWLAVRRAMGAAS